MAPLNNIRLLLLGLFFSSTVNAFSPIPATTSARQCKHNIATSSLRMGFFDNIKLLLSDEGRKNREEYEAKLKAEEEEAWREMQARRRNPEKMAEYESDVSARRKKYADEREEFNNKQNQFEVKE